VAANLEIRERSGPGRGLKKKTPTIGYLVIEEFRQVIGSWSPKRAHPAASSDELLEGVLWSRNSFHSFSGNGRQLDLEFFNVKVGAT
jgi:hypothetical protein